MVIFWFSFSLQVCVYKSRTLYWERKLVPSISSNSNEKHNHYENTGHYEDCQPSEAWSFWALWVNLDSTFVDPTGGCQAILNGLLCGIQYLLEANYQVYYYIGKK